MEELFNRTRIREERESFPITLEFRANSRLAGAVSFSETEDVDFGQVLASATSPPIPLQIKRDISMTLSLKGT